MKRIVTVLFMLLTATSLSAQCIKGRVSDAKYGDSIPFVNVVLLRDSDTVRKTMADLDGEFIFRSIDTGFYDVGFDGGVRYSPITKTGVKVLPHGFTFLNVVMQPVGTCLNEVEIVDTVPIIEIGKPEDAAEGTVPTKTVELQEYKVVDKGLQLLLDRVVECREHMYDADPETYGFERKPMPEGTTCDLRMATMPYLDSSRNEYGSYIEYLYYVYEQDSLHRLPLPLEDNAPRFQMDKPLVKVDVNTTHGQGEACEALGYVEYRGVIFFLGDFRTRQGVSNKYFKTTGRKRTFQNGGARYVGPTWTYSFSEGHWYRWIEFPVGW